MSNSIMNESLDIAFLVVPMKPLNILLSEVACMISSMVNSLKENDWDIRLALIKVEAGTFLPTIHSFTRSLSVFQSWFMTNHHDNDASYIQYKTVPIDDAFREALKLNWRTMNHDQCHENMVILITDGFPCWNLIKHTTSLSNEDNACVCNDLWTISNEFVNRNLTLVIVGIGSIVSICDNLYAAIAKNTGGEYLPIKNASNILFLSIQSIMTQGYTLSQSFRHIKQEEFEKNSPYHHSTIQEKQNHLDVKHCHLTTFKGTWLLNYYFHRIDSE